MSQPTLQIDLKPVSQGESFTSYYMNIYFNGNMFRGIVSRNQAEEMNKEGLVIQTYGQREIDGKLERFEYPEKVDGAGVQYTSPVFELKLNP
ncbi:MAG: hypothetical protein K9H61_02420 [Bacteroidia bacterium]|nr:hypothetical protein [Bacteroidia bacterium]MCF8427181.1 hypothetical protein [Bacteroidia bacterium]MCF8445826.1 hypothetical protein [Bacteroidia bacterium]